jgi:hypothetical protein
LLTRPGHTSKSYAKDSSQRAVKLLSANYLSRLLRSPSRGGGTFHPLLNSLRLSAAQVRRLAQPSEPTIADFLHRSTSLPGFVELPIKARHKTLWLPRLATAGPVTTRLDRSPTRLRFPVRLPAAQVRRSAKSPEVQSADLQHRTISPPSLTELPLLALHKTP